MKITSLPNLLYHYFQQVRSADLVLIFSGYLIGFQFIIFVASLMRKQVIFRSSMLGGDDALSLLRKNVFLRAINRIALKRLSLYFAINSEFSRLFRNSFQEKIRIFESYQGVDEARFCPIDRQNKIKLRLKLGIEPEKRIIVSAGILLSRKGYTEIFTVLSALVFDFSYFVLGATGPSPFHRLSMQESEEMKDLFSLGKKALGEKINFKGFVSDPETYYRVADIYIHGGKQEGTPNALLEAMACGLPCIVKNLPGTEGQLAIHNKNAVTFEHYKELPGIIEKLFSNPDFMNQIGMSAAKTMIENYTFEEVANRLLQKLND